jgi:hypothetical protein
LNSIASFIPLTSKFGTIEVYKSQNDIIIRSAFSIAFKALELAFTSGVKNALVIFKLILCFGTSILSSQ